MTRHPRARPSADAPATKALLAAGAAGPVAFVTGYLVNGAMQPGYRTRQHTISTLSLARHGWIQDANFLLYGASTLCFADGLRHAGAASTPAVALLRVAGVGLVAIARFRSDPILGFPPGEPTVTTSRGGIHNAASLLVFGAFPAAALATTRRPIRGWGAFSIATGVGSLAAIAAFFASVSAAEGDEDATSAAGLWERVPTVLVGLWQVASVIRALTGRAAPATADQSRSPGQPRRLRTVTSALRRLGVTAA